MTATMLDHALQGAAAGFEVFPLNGKVPAIAGGNGCLDATTDLEVVRGMWTPRPHANIGVRVPDGQVVIDVDPRHGGDKGMELLEAVHGPLPATRTVLSGRGDGGTHRYYLAPEGRLTGKPLPDGVDLKTRGGYVVAPPSLHPDTGQPYVWLDTREPVTMPLWLADLIVRKDAPAEYVARPHQGDPFGGDPFGGDSIADSYSVSTTWSDVLVPHGWRLRAGDGDSDDSVWLHPAATSATSATVRHGCLFVYSSNTPFEVTTDGDKNGYTRFRAYSVLNHGGDLRAAARHLRTAASPPSATTRPAPRMAASDPSAVVPVAEPPALDVSGFWEERAVHQHLLTFARSRMVSPWALLGVSIVRVLAVIPPHVVLPPLVGSPGSLNTFVGLVGPSGGGKGAAEGAALDALDVGTVEVHGAGSGEGLLHLYVRHERKQLHQHRTSVLLSVPEVDTLVALKSRQGSTLLPILRSAWSGESLAFGYADPDKALKLERHSYRLGMVVGIQPGRAAPLLDDSDGGTPQRFLWLPTTDRDSPDELPPTPEQWRVAPHSWFAAGRHELVVPDVARQAVQDNRRRVIRGDGEALDGHALLARLKTAQALALLDGRRDMTEDDWRLSGTVLAVSDATRAGVQAYLSQQARSSNLARARSEGERTAVADDVAAEHAVQRCGRLIQRHLLARGEQARSDLRKLLPSRDRRWFDESLEALRTAGLVVVQGTDHGERVALHGTSS